MLGLVLLVNAGIHRTIIRCAEIGTTGASDGETAVDIIAEFFAGMSAEFAVCWHCNCWFRKGNSLHTSSFNNEYQMVRSC